MRHFKTGHDYSTVHSQYHPTVPRNDKPTILFAGGGSGGHLSPGLAIAERLAEHTPPVRCVFVCSNRPLDVQMLGRAAVTFETVPASPPSTRPGTLLSFVRNYRATQRQAEHLLKQYDVDHVVALGGFVAAPVVAAASRQRIPTTLLNLDHPPGKANRLIARRCDRVWSAVGLPRTPTFAQEIVGMPVRRGAMAHQPPDACRAALGLHVDQPTLLVTGASQGAHSINVLMQHLVEHEPHLFDGWQVLHLCGSTSQTQQSLESCYRDASIPAVVESFVHEMRLAWGAADAAISRAGASSVAEAAINAVPTLFLPYPHHRDQHQRWNAEPLRELGGAMIADDCIEPQRTAQNVRPALQQLLHEPAARDAMRQSLLSNRPEDAAGMIAGKLRSMLSVSTPTPA